MTRRHLTVEDVAVRFRTTEKAIYNMRHRGELPPALKIGRHLLWTEEAIEAFELERTEAVGGVREVPRTTVGTTRPKDYSAWFKTGRPA